ncbi:MAG: CBS domain-containing protein [Nitrosomonas sp.]|nr:MAG: CBS domain-containing protein [Nitrosomonas sp.]
MMNGYKSLAVQHLSGQVSIVKPALPNPVTFDSPALEVMTDLRSIPAAVIAPNITMEIANAYMMQRGVRTLLVMYEDNLLAGIITATDILGEKPMRFIQERGVKHNEILVMDIMTPLEMLEAIPLEEVMHARVGNIVASLRESGRLHALAIDDKSGDLPRICGIFSWTQIEKQLGIKIEQTNAAQSFAEIESALAAG